MKYVLKVLILVFSLLECRFSYAEIQRITESGNTEVCFATREFGINLARTGATNKAYESCRALGPDWSYKGKIFFQGYEQCFDCGRGNGYRCEVSRMIFGCESTKKEDEEKARLRAEKAAAEKAAKEAVVAKELAEKKAADKVLADKAVAEKAAKEAAAAKKLAEKKAADKVLADKAVAVKAAKEAAAAKKFAEKKAADKVRTEKAAADKASKENAAKSAKEVKEKARLAKKEDAKADSNLKRKDVYSDKADKIYASKTVTGLGASVLDGGGGNAQSDVHSLLDESAERPVIQKRLAQELKAYGAKVRPACQQTLTRIDACFAKTGCNRPVATPTVEQCNAIPWRPAPAMKMLTLTKIPNPGELCYRTDAECLRARDRWAREEREQERRDTETLRQERREWDNEYGARSAECKVRKTEREAFTRCQKGYASTCNPDNLNSVDECVAAQAAKSGPRENDARKLMQKEWHERSLKATSITDSILD